MNDFDADSLLGSDLILPAYTPPADQLPDMFPPVIDSTTRCLTAAQIDSLVEDAA